MKITYVANVRIPTERAHGIQIMKMCEAFAHLGNEVELVIPKRKNFIKTDPFEYYSVEKTFKIRYLPTLDLVRFGWIGFWIQSLTFSESAAWYVLSKKGLFYTREELLAFFLRTMGKKVTWEVHMGQVNFFARALLSLGVPIVTITGKLKDLYMRRGLSESRILVAPDAVDLRKFEGIPSRKELQKEFGLPENKIIISYIGKFKTLGQSKGVEDVVKPFAESYMAHPNIFLLVVGPEAEEVIELETLLSKTSVPKEAYRIIGHVEHKFISHYMKASNVLLMMYPNITHYALYMSPLKLFEYMASGTPILASRLPSLEEILNDKNAYFFEPNDTNDFINQLELIIENQSEAEKKSIQAALDVREYTWEKRAERILNFIQKK